jgi:hypothetical protein
MDDARTQRLEAVLAVLLGIGAIITAFAAYQASLKDGATVKAYNEGIRALSDANTFHNLYSQQVDHHETIFFEWEKARKTGDHEMASFIRHQLMEPNLRRAVREYDNSDVATPTETRVYDDGDFREARRLERVTKRRFRQAQAFDDTGDTYQLAGVVGAVALFFLGVAGVFRSWRMKLTATAIGTLVLVLAGLLLVSV